MVATDNLETARRMVISTVSTIYFYCFHLNLFFSSLCEYVCTHVEYLGECLGGSYLHFHFSFDQLSVYLGSP